MRSFSLTSQDYLRSLSRPKNSPLPRPLPCPHATFRPWATSSYGSHICAGRQRGADFLTKGLSEKYNLTFFAVAILLSRSASTSFISIFPKDSLLTATSSDSKTVIMHSAAYSPNSQSMSVMFHARDRRKALTSSERSAVLHQGLTGILLN